MLADGVAGPPRPSRSAVAIPDPLGSFQWLYATLAAKPNTNAVNVRHLDALVAQALNQAKGQQILKQTCGAKGQILRQGLDIETRLAWLILQPVNRLFERFMQNRLARAEVPVEQTWNLDDLFASPLLWEAEVLALESACDDLQPYRGRLGDGAGTLQACLDAMEVQQQRLVPPRSTPRTKPRSPTPTPAG